MRSQNYRQLSILVEKMTKTPYKHYHRDGSLYATGTLNGDTMEGYWEWFRKDGTIMRSGHFKNGKQVGEWVTYDKTGKTVKKTMKKE